MLVHRGFTCQDKDPSKLVAIDLGVASCLAEALVLLVPVHHGGAGVLAVGPPDNYRYPPD